MGGEIIKGLSPQAMKDVVVHPLGDRQDITYP
jgi:hypothetical protein